LEWLGEDIRDHFFSSEVGNVDFIFLDPVTYPELSDIDVSRCGRGDSPIVDRSDSRHVVLVNLRRLLVKRTLEGEK
jgi:hypothetical protein